MSIGGGGSGTSGTVGGAPREQVGQQQRSGREVGIRDARGDLVGNNYVIPKGDFAHFLGYKPPTKGELNGTTPVSANRAIEVALQKEANIFGEGAAKNGNEYRNVAISWGRYAGEPGREADTITSARDAIRQGPGKGSVEPAGIDATKTPSVPGASVSSAQLLERTQELQKKSHNDNVRLLEMQYRFLEAGKNESVISNLMKVRSDSVKSSIHGSNS